MRNGKKLIIQFFLNLKIQRRFIWFIFFAVLVGCSKPLFRSAWIKNVAPEKFKAKFETSKGNFEIEVIRKQSPKAVDRFFQLLKHHILDNSVFYRVVPKFVVQFGNNDSTVIKPWEEYKISDEPTFYSNTRGTLSFARGGKETRSMQLFINLIDNSRLDTIKFEGVQGFPAFGKVIKGMVVVDSIYSGYGNSPMYKLDTLNYNRYQFLKTYPKLDIIKKAYLIKYKSTE